ncbi:hypothetical protein B0J14DRAFT_22999 [Halenospora varia]|nr:hypothetical protein B0J14DRAFT_22999 [Halenospora varia]
MLYNSFLTVFAMAISLQTVIALPTPHVISQKDTHVISPMLERRSLPLGDFLGDIAERTPGGSRWGGRNAEAGEVDGVEEMRKQVAVDGVEEMRKQVAVDGEVGKQKLAVVNGVERERLVGGPGEDRLEVIRGSLVGMLGVGRPREGRERQVIRMRR